MDKCSHTGEPYLPFRSDPGLEYHYRIPSECVLLDAIWKEYFNKKTYSEYNLEYKNEHLDYRKEYIVVCRNEFEEVKKRRIEEGLQEYDFPQ